MTNEEARVEAVCRLLGDDCCKVMVPIHGEVHRSADGRTVWVEAVIEMRDYAPKGKTE